MGEEVYATGEPLREGVHLYAHSRKDGKPGVCYVLINTSKEAVTEVELPRAAACYTLSADSLRSSEIRLNGEVLRLTEDEQLPELRAESAAAGVFCAQPATINFFVLDA